MPRYDIKALRRKFKEFDIQANRDIAMIIDEGSRDIVNLAKKKAPADNGKLIQSIGYEIKDNGMRSDIFAGGSNAPYAPYVELGTKLHVKIPTGFEDLASQYKGKGNGDLDEFFQNIREWVKRKNIGGTYSIKTKKATTSKASSENIDRAAWFIAMSILKKGIKPQPFLIPAFLGERDKIPVNIDKFLQRSAKEFNKD